MSNKFQALLAVAVLTAGCAQEPALPLNPPTSAPTGADRAQEIVVEMMTVMFDQNLGEPPMISWFDSVEGVCGLVYEEMPEGYENDDRCLLGRYYGSTNEIHLRKPATDIPSQSVIAHEHLHWALYQVNGDADSNHSSPLWNELATFTLALRAEGL